MRDAKAGAGADDADRAARGQRLSGPSDAENALASCLRHGMADGFEIIDDV
jgi:hypothetical protein